MAGTTAHRSTRSSDIPLLSTGIPGLDGILAGGLPSRRLYLVDGAPGTGKTTLALQFLLAGAARNEPGLYVTLSESEEELEQVATSHGWSLDGIDVVELPVEDAEVAGESYTIFHPAEVELQVVIDRMASFAADPFVASGS